MTVRRTPEVGGVAGTTSYAVVDGDGAVVDGPTVAVVGLMHGNEVVGGHVLARLAERVDDGLVCGSLLAVEANMEAAALGVRHTPEGSDMNRFWDRDALEALASAPEEGLGYEQRRVRDLAPLLLECDAILDLHSTTRPSPPFLLFRDDQRHAAVAAALGVRLLVTGIHEDGVLGGGMCPDIGLRSGERHRRLGFTFEAGQHADPTNVDRGWDVLVRLLYWLGMWSEVPEPCGEVPEVYEVMDRFRQAPAGAVPYRFVGYQGGEPGGGRRGALRTLASFEEVQADEVVLRRGRTGVVRAQAPFTILLPTPAAHPGGDLYYLAQRRRGGVAVGEPARTDAEARREALAIERMLDVLDDDDLERGTSWATFESRHSLDLCAALVARVVRLTPGHPHRRITVVGRGDFGGSETERRLGRRYRAAMRGAVLDGVPIDRVQLLRGTSLGWLDALTSTSMTGFLAQRTARRETQGFEGTAIRFFLSARQPHTVSVLVVGDLERALDRGEYRHVRVLFLVEAATVEPDGERAAIRTVRTGVISARPEILGATRALLAALRDEHRSLLEHPPLCELDPALLDHDGGLLPSTDPVRGEQLRAAMRSMLAQLWAPPLRRHARVAPVLEGEDLGRWLVSLMRATGILDAAALKALLLSPVDGGWVVDPDGLERRLAQAAELDLGQERARPGPGSRLLARDVDGDGLQRWISWKRMLRRGQAIPDTRGKDVDLEFSESGIQRRISKWYRVARQLAWDNPGRVLVVVAGDGLSPNRDTRGTSSALLTTHQELLLDPTVRYLRLQHAQGADLSWLKGFSRALAHRPSAGQQVALQWEAEHGASVNVVLIARRDRDAVEERPWSLDGWSIEHCGVVISDLQLGAAREYRVGIFTEPLPGSTPRLNQELAHFGRAHCEGLLSQGGVRVWSEPGQPAAAAFEDAVVAQIAEWIERVRDWRHVALSPPPEAHDERVDWVAGWLGVADRDLSRALALQVGGDEPPDQAARRIWADVEPWIGGRGRRSPAYPGGGVAPSSG